MTLDQVTTAQELIALIGTQREFHSTEYTNADQTPMRYRLNGMIKTFKRDNTRIRMPLKYGMGYSRNDYMVIESVAEFKSRFTLKP